jgi:hypothetical protein
MYCCFSAFFINYLWLLRRDDSVESLISLPLPMFLVTNLVSGELYLLLLALYKYEYAVSVCLISPIVIRTLPTF